MAIPRLEEKSIDNCPTERGNTAILVVIVTWYHSTGGLPRQFANWLAMTAYLYKHQFIVRIRLKVYQMRWGTVETVGLRHRKSSLVIKTPPNEKALAPPGGSKDRKHFSAVPPCLPPARPLMTMPTHRLPHNAGNASKILRPTARSLRPLRPICCPAARSALSTRNSLWRRQAALLPLRRFEI